MEMPAILKSHLLKRSQKACENFYALNIKYTQEQVLLSILKQHSHTTLGQKFLFATLSADHYQKTFPVGGFEELYQDYLSPLNYQIAGHLTEQNPRYYAQTSGTSTGAAKLIPISNEQLKASSTASILLLHFNLVRTKDPGVLLKKKIWLVDPVKPTKGKSSFLESSISSIARFELPALAKRGFIPQKALPSENKVKSIIAEAQGKDIVAISGMNTWLLNLFREIEEQGHTLKSYWPLLRLIHCGGTPLAPYLPLFEKHLKDIRLVETYAASEGFLGMQSLEEDGLIPFFNHGIFYEFENLETGKIFPLWEIQPSTEYGLIITNFSGLYRYRLGDKVVFHKLLPLPTFKVTGRVSERLDFFNEHVLISEVEKALQEIIPPIQEWTIGSDVSQKQHVIFIETNEELKLKHIVAFDEKLKTLNAYYAKYRQGDELMNLPKFVICRIGTLSAWLRKQKEDSFQLKIPKILTPVRQKNLEEFLNQRPS